MCSQAPTPAKVASTTSARQMPETMVSTSVSGISTRQASAPTTPTTNRERPGRPPPPSVEVSEVHTTREKECGSAERGGSTM